MPIFRFKGFIVFSSALATNHYEMAQKSREASINQNEYALSDSKESFMFQYSPWPEIIRKRKEEYAILKKAMDTNDRAYIAEYLADNEKEALDSYIRNFHGKRIYEKYQIAGHWPLENS